MVPALIPMGALIGGIVSGAANLIGGKKRQSNVQNALRLGFDHALESPLATEFSPTGAAANKTLAGVLGVGGDPAASRQAIDNFLSTPGFEFIRDRALEGVTSSASARGKLNSGATLKALQDRAGQIAATQLPQFLGQLNALSTRGIGADRTITGAGSAVAGANANAVREGQNSRLRGIGTLAGTAGDFLDDVGFNPLGI